MEGLGAASSVIAVIEISTKIVKLCLQYSLAVKNAKNDIEHLQKKVADIKNVLEAVKQLLDGPDPTILTTTQKLSKTLPDCFKLLDELKRKLEPGKPSRAMRRLGMRDLKWPFKSKQVDDIITSLSEYEQTFNLALQVDQTFLIHSIDQKLDLARLPVAKGASFNSYVEEHKPRCLAETRVELLRQITEWTQDKNGKLIYWLSGMAGTGKSTIARTVAQSFASQQKLGASFFFLKGEGERRNASRFFTTIAKDLMVHVPRLTSGIRRAIDDDPDIPKKNLKDQFEKLILHPLDQIQPAARGISEEFFIVIDALDECESQDDIKLILRLLAQTRANKPISLRVFVTSRPELPIRHGFKQMLDGTYQDLVLHEVPKETVEQDITLFFEHQLQEIREQRLLSLDWPSKAQVQALVKLAIPLFIFCREVECEHEVRVRAR